MVSMWVVYDKPSDFPDQFVARRHIVKRGLSGATSDHMVAGSLEEIRGKLPQGLFKIRRAKEDDPAIVEVWL